VWLIDAAAWSDKHHVDVRVHDYFRAGEVEGDAFADDPRRLRRIGRAGFEFDDPAAVASHAVDLVLDTPR